MKPVRAEHQIDHETKDDVEFDETIDKAFENRLNESKDSNNDLNDSLASLKKRYSTFRVTESDKKKKINTAVEEQIKQASDQDRMLKLK